MRVPAWRTWLRLVRPARAPRRRPAALAWERLEDRLAPADWAGDVFDAVPGVPTWTNNEVQRIIGDVRVPAGQTLTVQAGTVIKFNVNTNLVVEGTLNADGALGTIHYTSFRDDTLGGDSDGGGASNGSPGDWANIFFAASSTANVLTNVNINFGGGGIAPASVTVDGAPLNLNDSTVRNSLRSGVRVIGATPTLSNDIFAGNGAAAISMTPTSNPAITAATVIANGTNGVLVDGGTLTGSTSWNDPDIVYLLAGDVTVPQGSTLTLGAGQVVKFTANIHLLVNGAVQAPGTQAQPIIFTSQHDDSAQGNSNTGDTNGNGNATGPSAGDWGGIQFNAGGPLSSLDNFEVRFGGGSIDAASITVATPVNFSNGSVRNSLRAGMRITQTAPTVDTVAFVDNTLAAISMDPSSNPAITAVTVTNNGTNGVAVDGGNLSASNAWDDPGIVYLLAGDVTVPQGLTLAIAAGQVVKFNVNLHLLIDGTLLANGNAANPVIFTSFRDDSAQGGSNTGDTNNNGADGGSKGDWGGIRINAGSTASQIQNAQIRFGGGNVEAAPLTIAAPLTLSNSTVRDSLRHGVNIVSSSPTLGTNTFADNNLAAVRMNVASSPAIVAATVTGNGINGLQVEPGSIDADNAWDDPGIVYFVAGDVSVSAGNTLTIAAGQVIKFAANTHLLVAGAVQGSGSAAAPIVFTSLHDDTALGGSNTGDTNNNGNVTGPAPGQWAGIQFNNTTVPSLLDNVEVRFGGGNVDPASLTVRGPLTLSNSVVRDSLRHGVTLVSSSPTFATNTFANNALAAINMDPSSNPAISAATVTNNGTNGVLVDGGNVTVDNAWDDPGIVYRLAGDVTVPQGRTLTIAAGQVVKFNVNLHLLVDGTLLASGNAGNPVIFTSFRDDSAQGSSNTGDTNNDGASTGSKGDWGGIRVNAAAAGNTLDFVEIRFGGGNVEAAPLTVSAPLTLSNSTVRDSLRHGVRIISSNPALTTNSFLDNDLAAVSMNLAASPLITGFTATGNAINGLQLDAGTIALDNAWNDPDIVYFLAGDVTVAPGATLTIAAGQAIKFAVNAHLLIGGALQATGTTLAPIIFTSLHDDGPGDTNGNGNATAPSPGDWGGIQFDTNAAASLVDHAEVRFGGGSVDGAALTVRGPLTLSNSTVRNSLRNGVDILDANPILIDDSFLNNTLAALTMTAISNPLVTGSTTIGNGTNGMVVTGNLNQANSWDDPDVVYVVGGINVFAQLTITAGQVIKFLTNGIIAVSTGGSLQVTGTAAAPVIFTSIKDDTAQGSASTGDTNGDGAVSGPGKGDWAGLDIRPDAAANVLDRVQIRFAGGAIQPAALTVDVAALTLRNSIVSNSLRAGLRINQTAPSLVDNTFSDNTLAAISMDPSSSPDITGTTIVTGNGSNGVVVDAGTLGGTYTWDDAGVVYLLAGDVTVPQASTLTIGAGQVVKFSSNAHLLIDGALQVVGTAAAPVTFTSFKDDTVQGGSNTGDTNGDGAATTPARGDWGGVQFRAGATLSIVDRTEVRFAGGSVDAAALTVHAPLNLNHSSVRDSLRAGMRIQQSNPSLNEVSFFDNNLAAMSMDLASNPTVVGGIRQGNGDNALVADGGTLAANLDWTGSQAPYALAGDVIVPNGLSLTLGQLTTFRADAGRNLFGTGTLVNEGTFLKNADSNVVVIMPAVVNRGRLQVENGTLRLAGALTNDGQGILAGLNAGTLEIAGDVGGSTSETRFLARSRVLLNGTGTQLAPQNFEALSDDLGSGPPRLVANFLFFDLAVGGNNYVKLVDSVDNTPDAGPEALYVNNLVVPIGSTLDLNGIVVYARRLQLDGTVIGTTLRLSPDTTAPTALIVAPPLRTNQDISAVTIAFDEAIDDVSGFVLAITTPQDPLPALAWTIVQQDAATYVVSFLALTDEGSYEVRVSGPGLVDLNGNAPALAFVSTIILDRTAPQLVAATPTGTLAAAVDHLDLTFSEHMNLLSLTAANLSLAGPGGAIALGATALVGGTTYRIPFASQSANGAYVLTIGAGVQDIAGNAIAAAQQARFTLALPPPTKVIATAPAVGDVQQAPQVVNERIAAPTETELFRFTAVAGQVIRFQVTAALGTRLDSILRLFDEAGNQLAFNDDGTTLADLQSRNASFVFRFARGGTFFIGVSGFPNVRYDAVTGAGAVPGSTGSFSLSLTTVPPPADGNDQLAEARSLGTATRASRVSDQVISDPTDVDMFRFRAGRRQQVAIVVARPAGSRLAPLLRVFSASGRQLASSARGVLTFTAATAGTFFVGVSGRGNAGYSAASGDGDSDGAVGGYSIALAPNSAADRDSNGRLERATSLGTLRGRRRATGALSSAADVDLFRFTVASGQRLSFEASSRAGLPLLRLFDGDGVQLATGAGRGRFDFTFLVGGNYFLGVSSRAAGDYDALTGAGNARAGKGGAYQVTMAVRGTQPAPFADNPAAPTTFRYTSTAAGMAGLVYFDQSGDGQRQPGETGQGEHIILLDRNSNGVRDDGEQATTTNAQGLFLLHGRGGVPIIALPAVQFGIPIEKITNPRQGFYTIQASSRQAVINLAFGMGRYLA